MTTTATTTSTTTETIDTSTGIMTAITMTTTTGWRKSHDTEKNIKYLPYDLIEEGDLLINGRSVFKLYFHQDTQTNILCQVSLLISIEKFYFFTDNRKTIYLTKNLSMHVFRRI